MIEYARLYSQVAICPPSSMVLHSGIEGYGYGLNSHKGEWITTARLQSSLARAVLSCIHLRLNSTVIPQTRL